MNESLSVGIIGAGMVGAPLGRYFKEIRGLRRGGNLLVFDVDPKKRCQDDINKADVVFVCVPTPRKDNGSADLTAVRNAVGEIKGSKIVVLKSTVPPGTTEGLQKEFSQHEFLFNPEFLTELRAWENTLHPERQLVGWTKESRSHAATVLALLPPASVSAPSRELDVCATEAEIIKYAANVFLTRKVTFANAIFDLAEHHGVNYEHVCRGIASDSRIGPSHLDVHYQGYRGYGGYCFVKDTDALIAHCRTAGLDRAAELLEADRVFNDKVLADQGLTARDVSVHDHEWIKKKLNGGR